MNTTTKGILAVTVALLVGATACTETTEPHLADELSPEYAKGGGGRGGGPGGGGESGPSAGNVITTFADALGDGVLSDGDGVYRTIKKKQEVESEITSDGRFWLDVNPGPANRALCVSFPSDDSDAVIVSEADWDDLTAGGDIALGATYCGEMLLHSRDHQHAGKFLDMDATPGEDPDDVQTSGGKLVLVGLGAEEWEWRLFFDDNHSQVNGGDLRNGLCIRYNEDGSWTGGADPTIDDTSEEPGTCDAVDEWLNLIRVTQGDAGAVYTHVARFRMPFQFTATPQ
jgi:hypothetical protein